MVKIVAIYAFEDNYIWAWHANKTSLVVVDPGSSSAVINYCNTHKLNLTHILVTHRHSDHTGGVKELQKHYNAKVYAPKNTLSDVDFIEVKQQKITLHSVDFNVIPTAGHTDEHISYYAKNLKAVFCGDTLFAAGCGRVFDGSFIDLMQSLKTLSSLPTDTNIYPAHEYSLNNLTFALTFEPNNLAIENTIIKYKKLRQQNLPTLPTNVEQELQVNPFLRCQEKPLINNFIAPVNKLSAIDAFIYLREAKNNF